MDLLVVVLWIRFEKCVFIFFYLPSQFIKFVSYKNRSKLDLNFTFFKSVRIQSIWILNKGTPMAINLVKTGHEVGVWNRSSDKTKPVSDAGASVYSSKENIGNFNFLRFTRFIIRLFSITLSILFSISKERSFRRLWYCLCLRFRPCCGQSYCFRWRRCDKPCISW